MKSLILTSLLMTLSVYAQFDHTHQLWDEVLTKHVSRRGLVNYQALRSQDRPKLDQYLESLSQADVTNWKRDQKLAFYINAYNAFTIKTILDHYPIKPTGLNRFRFPANSIRQIPGVWDKLKFQVAGEMLTLEAIEHNILREELSEPRIHFAIVCASMGCPTLQSRAFTGTGITDELNKVTKSFLRNTDKVRLDERKKTLYLSLIFKWFKEDFEGFKGFADYGKYSGIVSFIAAQLPKFNSQLKSDKFDIEWMKYDWSLNEQ